VLARRVRDAIGELDTADAGADRQHPIINAHDLVLACRGHVNHVMCRHRPDACRSIDTRDLCDHLRGVEIEDHQASGVHVTDKQAPRRRIDTLVVEAVRRPREWNVLNQSQRAARRVGRCRDRPVPAAGRQGIRRGDAAWPLDVPARERE